MFDTPGVLSATRVAAGELSSQYADGIDWHAVQVQNGTLAGAPQFGSLPSGMKKVAWGVTYSPEEFVRDGATLAGIARGFNCDGLIIDAEECLKGADPRPLIEQLSAFEGPKALTTIGSTSDWTRWTLADTAGVQVKPWVDAGYWLMPQAYFNEEDFFHPYDCLQHWLKCGWPLARINLMIGTHRSAPDKSKPNNRLDGAAYAELLSSAGVPAMRPNRRALSIFLAETTFDEDYEALASFLSRPAPDPLGEAIEALRPVVDAWRAKGMGSNAILRQRIGFALEVLETPLTEWYGPKFVNVDALIAELSDD